MARLIFLPGVGADPAFWRPVGALLPAVWEKNYLGWPGLANQPADPAVNSYEDLIGLVEAALGDAPADLLAQSMGGAIALHLALRHPGRIRRLVLTASSDGVDMGALGANDWRTDYRQTHPHVASWVYDWRPNLTAEIARITQPTLLLWGDADPVSPVAVGDKLRDLLPNARLHIVPNGDHMFARDRPEEIAGLIRAHLQTGQDPG